MVPVVVLTGFLGSGKTTLLNKLLAVGSPTTGKLAVIVNEFGAVGIDGDLLPADMSRQVELPGGCVCCVLDDDLGLTITELLESDPAIDLIVIETTGIAEPLPISWTLGAEPLSALVRLAAVVTTVDVLEHRRHRPLSPSVDAQVDSADILIVTKTDLSSAEETAKLIAELREQNRFAPILEGDVTAQFRAILLDPSQHSARSLEHLGKVGHGHEHASSTLSNAAGHGHRSIQSVAVELVDALDFEELSDQLQELPENYLRIKGIADVEYPAVGWDDVIRVAFHRVGARVSVEPLKPGQGGTSRLVAVGYDLDEDALRACVAEAVLAGDESNQA